MRKRELYPLDDDDFGDDDFELVGLFEALPLPFPSELALALWAESRADLGEGDRDRLSTLSASTFAICDIYKIKQSAKMCW